VKRKIAAGFGRSGLGKSTLAYNLAKQHSPPVLVSREPGEDEAVHVRGGVIVFDPNAQYDNGLVVSSLRDLEQAHDWRMVIEGPLIYRPHDDVWREFFDFADLCWELEGTSVIVDESSFLQNASGIHPRLDKLVRLGRTREISIFTTQHRVQDAYGIYLTLATDYYFFQTTHPRDLERIEEHTSEEARRRVERLRAQEFLHWDVAEACYSVILDSDSWREDIHIAPAQREEVHEQ